MLGGRPQHIARHDQWGHLRIGSRNMIRENVTIHRAMSPDSATVVGDDNLIMVNAHVAHDCRVGSHTIITNNVMLAGHVTVGDYAYLSGGVGVHQFCRIGSHCMVGGQSHINKDVPPYVTVDGQSTRVVGLNVIGLKRRGFTPEEILQLKQAYRIIYRQGLTWEQVLETLSATFTSGPAADFYPFLRVGQRGFILERRTPVDATIPLPQLKVEPESSRDRGDAAESRVSRCHGARCWPVTLMPHCHGGAWKSAHGPAVHMTEGGLGSPPARKSASQLRRSSARPARRPAVRWARGMASS